MIILIDNYDSFSYNLYQLVGTIDPDIKVIRNDELTVDEIRALKPSRIILSPGPGFPKDAGICIEAAKTLGKEIPTLGVCLGHQAICEAYGATVSYAKELMHGKQSTITIDETCPIFQGMGNTMKAARYHSLAAVKETIPETLKVTAKTKDGEVMAVMHQKFLTITQTHKIYEEDKKMIKEATAALIDGKDLTYEQANAVINEIMNGETSQVQTAAFLTALSTKGETIEEITACAAAMRSHALPVQYDGDLLEIVGTGGDGAGSFNISTTSSIVIAAGGVPVAKHGNRAASSKSGAADCLEALGVNIQLAPEQCVRLLKKIGICFFFAQKYHTSMKYVGPVRKELGVRTVFNLLGPLTNPGHANLQVLGVYAEHLVEPMAKVLYQLGVKRGMVVYGQDKLDEISMCAPTTVCEFGNGEYKTYVIRPEDFGMKTAQKDALKGGTPEENAAITRAILAGEKGVRRDAVLLNAGAGLYVGGKADSLADGVKLAATLIDEGMAQQTLNAFIRESNKQESVAS